jgi:hypothetical protein
MGFRLVTAEHSIMFDNDQDLFNLGTLDEESWIVYENDNFIIEEYRTNGRREFNITIKEKDGTLEFSVINSICEDMKNLRKDLDRLMSVRSDVFDNFRYANKHAEY